MVPGLHRPICQSLLGRLQLLVRLRDEQERRRATNLHGVHAARTDYRRFDTVTVASYGGNRCGYLVYDVFCYYR